jgi:Leucine-rich repeat (LRR) protein
LTLLQRLDLSGNKLSGALPNELGNPKNMKWMLLGGNNLTEEIPYQFGRLIQQNRYTINNPVHFEKVCTGKQKKF